MDFTAKRKTLKISIESEVFEIKAPSLKDLDQLQKDLKGKEADEVTDVYLSWFEGLGLSKEACLGLDGDDFIELAKFLQTPSKKK